jgi:hypothetical protein
LQQHNLPLQNSLDRPVVIIIIITTTMIVRIREPEQENRRRDKRRIPNGGGIMRWTAPTTSAMTVLVLFFASTSSLGVADAFVLTTVPLHQCHLQRHGTGTHSHSNQVSIRSMAPRHHSYRSEDTFHESTSRQSTGKLTRGGRRLFPAVLLLSAILAVGTFPLAANSGFGPSSGATTTPPPGLQSPQTLLQPEDLFKSSSKSGKKLRTAIGSTLDERRLVEFQTQLDVIIETLRERNNNNNNVGGGGGLLESTSTMTPEQEEMVDSLVQQEQLEKAELLQTQIQEREQLLDRLERQPYWFNYFAAFLGSVASTLVMHPSTYCSIATTKS